MRRALVIDNDRQVAGILSLDELMDAFAKEFAGLASLIRGGFQREVAEMSGGMPSTALQRMNKSNIRGLLLAAFASLAFSGCIAATRPAPQPTLAPGSYVSGGIGEQDRQDMRVTNDLYNLRLTFAENGTGAYVAGVTVVIESIGQGAHYDPFVDCGPLFNVVVQPGAYRVAATYAGVTLTKIFRVSRGATLGTFYWPGQANPNQGYRGGP